MSKSCPFVLELLCVCFMLGVMSSSTKDPSQTVYTLAEYDQEIPGWGVNVCRVTSEYVDPAHDTTIISGREICEHPKTEIVIVIQSKPGGSIVREAIRNSWGNLDGPQVKIGFMIGFSPSQHHAILLRAERDKFKDIIVESFIEAYYNLTIKSISILKWFVRTCPKAKFLLKADEDTFVDVPLLVHRLAKYRNSEGILRGYLCSNFDRDDRLWSKWYAPKYMYKHDKYPDFLQGSAYYMSRDAAVKLFAAALSTPIFHLEDVYITGLCAQKAEVRPEKEDGVVYLFGSPVRHCCSPQVITCNSVGGDELQWVLNERRNLINYSSMTDEVDEGIKKGQLISNPSESEPHGKETYHVEWKRTANRITGTVKSNIWVHVLLSMLSFVWLYLIRN